MKIKFRWFLEAIIVCKVCANDVYFTDGQIEIRNGRKYITCPYCGNEIEITHGYARY